MNVHGFCSRGEFLQLYHNFIQENSAPSILCHDNAKDEASAEVDTINHELYVKDQWSEPYYPNWNPVESCMIHYLKHESHTLLGKTVAPPQL